MATQKPISTISYNSKGFLLEKIEELYKAHKVALFMVIWHKGEDGDKDHFHVYLQPNTRLDPMEVKEFFNEYDPKNQKPLAVRPFRPSKEEDWIMYVVHDPEYLRLHGDEIGGKIEYPWQDIICPEDFDMQTAFIRARATLKHSSASVAKRIMDGEKPSSLALEGMNPLLVRGVVQLLSEDKFVELAAENARLRKMILDLEVGLKAYGFSLIEDDFGNLKLLRQEELSFDYEHNEKGQG